MIYPKGDGFGKYYATEGMVCNNTRRAIKGNDYGLYTTMFSHARSIDITRIAWYTK
jgi:hypothetical protein